MAPSPPHQKPATTKPWMNEPTNQKSRPLITKMNRPSVRIVAGSVSRIRIGRITVLTRPSTSAATSAEAKVATLTPGSRYATATSATVLISQTTSRRSKGLFPEPRWQRQARVILGGERALGRDAEALQHRDDLARVLRRVPGAALHHVV